MHCLSYFSIAVMKHHDQDHLEKGVLFGADSSGEKESVLVRDLAAGLVAGAAPENSHPTLKAGNREKLGCHESLDSQCQSPQHTSSSKAESSKRPQTAPNNGGPSIQMPGTFGGHLLQTTICS